MKNETGIAVDVGGTKINFAIINEQMKVAKRWTCHTTQSGGDALQEQLLRNMRHATESGKVSFAGICIPGIVDRNGTITWVPNIPFARNIRLRNVIESELGIPAFVTDDRTAAVLGEHTYHRVDNLVVVLIGTGLGAGIMLDGHSFAGTNGGVGAIGWNIDDESMRKHTEIGLTEEVISGGGIVNLSVKMGLTTGALPGRSGAYKRGKLTTKQVFEAFDRGDDIASRVMQKVTSSLSVQITNLVNTVNPSLVILNGTVGLEIAKRFLPSIRSFVRANALPVAAKVVKIKKSDIGDSSFIYGAALGAMNMLNARDGYSPNM